MHIQNLVAPLLMAAIALSGCTSYDVSKTLYTPPQPISFTATPEPVDYSCEPMMDVNWSPPAVPPASVVSAQSKDWQVARVHVGQLYVTYFRDCAAEVRGEVSGRYKFDPLLGAVFCNGDKLSSSLGRPMVDSRGVTESLVADANAMLTKLERSDACTTKVITPVR